ncbi:MAG: YoaP domain-containing protein [Bacteroides caccae]
MFNSSGYTPKAKDLPCVFNNWGVFYKEILKQ